MRGSLRFAPQWHFTASVGWGTANNPA